MTDEELLHERVAWLEGRVRALESALERRSMEIRLLQPILSREQLLLLSRVDEGAPVFPSLQQTLDEWQETVTLQAADVEVALLAMWSRLNPRATPEQGG